MIIKPKIRGFICTTTHPLGCEANVLEQINYTKAKGQLSNGPKRVLVVGASSGYGLSSRIAAAFGSGAATIGVFLKSPVRKANPVLRVGTTLPPSTSLPKQKDFTLKVLTVMLSAMKRKPKL
ncbi:hypothetical protein [Shewanella dokdonensis]|uniref:hypothetical protein n=1 Tax=Shewanella dokdonensis TaxID=712036 RepID=UPI003CC7D1D8